MALFNLYFFGSNMSNKLAPLVQALVSDNRNLNREVYSKLSIILQKKENADDLPQAWLDLAPSLKRDVVGSDVGIANSAVQVLQSLAGRVASLGDKEASDNLYLLISEMLHSTASFEVLRECFHNLFGILPCKKLMQIVHDTVLKCFKRRVPDEMKSEILDFLLDLMSDKENRKIDDEFADSKIIQTLLILTAVDSDSVREKALGAARILISDYPVLPSQIPSVANCLKTTIVPEIKKVYLKSTDCFCEVLSNQWPLFLKILGVNIKRSSSLINALLSTVEQGFRHSQSSVKTASFKVWGCLIDCLAEDREVLSSSRYMKLLMQPLTVTQPSDELNITRIKTLWRLANKLGPKLPMCFATVCLPILHCLLGNLDAERQSKRSMDNAAASSIKAKRSSSHIDGFYAALQATGYRATPKNASKSPRLQSLGVQILILMMQLPEDDAPEIVKEFQVPPLDFLLLSASATFVSQGQLLISAVAEVLCYLSGVADSLARLLWMRLHHHVRVHLEMNLKKKSREPELFNAFLLALENVINAKSLPERLVFEMLESFLKFPHGILSSTFYGGPNNGFYGVPALRLLKLLFAKSLIALLVPENAESIVNCAHKLILCGFENNVRILLFCQSVIDILQAYVHMLENTELSPELNLQLHFKLIAAVWIRLGKETNDHIVRSQEVNQGDSLDHDFSTLYSILLFSVSGLLDSACIETWNLLYSSFLWCCGFVTTCKPNEVCDHIASSVLSSYNKKWSDSTMLLLANICNTLTNHAEYNHGGFKKPGRPLHHDVATSPNKSALELHLQKHKNLERLCVLLKVCFNFAAEKSNGKICDLLMECMSHLFTSIHHTADIRLLFSYFVPSLKHLITFEGKGKAFGELFQSIVNAAGKAFANDEVVCPLLQDEEFAQFACNCWKQKDHKIRNVMVEFWQNVIVNSPEHSSLCQNISDSFKSSVFPVYRQMGWACPWKDIELPNSVELCDTTTSQGDVVSQCLSLPGYGAYGSPLKKHSFLSPRKSPSRAVSSPVSTPVKTLSAVKRKLASLSENVTFVKCSSPFPKPKTPLTEHQKEKLRQKSFIPTMYNDLDEKQDVEMDIQTPVDDGMAEELEKHASPGLEQQNTNSNDLIESSQTVEIENKRSKYQRLSKQKKKISLRSMASWQEEEAVLAGNTPRRSGRLKDSKAAENKILDQQEQASVLNDLTTEGDGENSQTDSTGAEMGHSECTDTDVSSEDVEMSDSSTNQTTSDTKAEGSDSLSAKNRPGEEMDTTRTINSDGSYEYVEMADLSTNQSRNDTSIDEKDTPLKNVQTDDVEMTYTSETTNCSYEYVEMVDLSTNQTKNNITIDCDNDDYNKDLGVSPLNVSDECIVDSMLDVMKGGIRNEADGDTKAAESSKDEADGSNEIKLDTSMADVGPFADVSTGILDGNDKACRQKSGVSSRKSTEHPQTEEPMTRLRRSQRNKRTSLGTETLVSKKVDVNDFISTDGEEVKFTEKNCRQSLNVSEYEYVSIVDASVVANTDQSLISGDEEAREENIKENVGDWEVEDRDVSADPRSDACSASMITEDETEEEDDDDDFMDARESLGESVQAMKNDLKASKKTSVFGDLMKASTEQDGYQSVIEKAIIIVDELSKDNKAVAENIHCDVNANTPTADAEPNVKNFGRTEDTESIAVDTQPLIEEIVADPDDIKLGNEAAQNNAQNSLLNQNQLSPSCDTGAVAKIPSLADLQNDSVLPAGQSPSARGILKRRCTIGGDVYSVPSPGNKRRVSFAASISESKCIESVGLEFQQSPRSSLMHKKSRSPKVSRRLSLQPEKKSTVSNEVTVSPLSLRSAQVAEAIANIRAKDTNSPSRFAKFANCKQTDESELDSSKIMLKDLENPDFIKSLSRSQLKHMVAFLANVTPVFIDALVKTMDP